MKIILVRHGQPDYKKDCHCLTELGHLQAEAAAERLKNSGIQKIYSSPLGRAYETALHTAAKFSLEVEKTDFMREISWASEDGSEILKNGNPWHIVPLFASENRPLNDKEWESAVPNSLAVTYAKGLIYDEADKWMESLGYTREGLYYRVGEKKYDTVAMFSHGGSSTMLLSRIFNLPFIYLCSSVQPDFTAITVIDLSDEKGTLVAPRFEIVNDTSHTKSICAENVYGF